MSNFLKFLNESGVEVKNDEIILKKDKFPKHMQAFFENAFKDILDEHCYIYRDAIEKGVEFHIYAEFPEKELSFNLKEQVESFLEDMK